MAFDGVHIRSFVSHNPDDARETCLTIDVYPLPFEVLVGLIKHIDEQVNAYLVAQKVVADVATSRLDAQAPEPQ